MREIVIAVCARLPRSNRIGPAALLVVAVVGAGSQAAAQLSCDVGLMPEGSWSGAFNLDAMSPQAEIALAAVLPPQMDATQLGVIRVLFACRTNCADAYPVPAVQTRTFVWNPREPDETTQLDVSAAPANLVGDVFCSGLTLDGQGDLWIAGGLNYPDKCAGNSCDVGTEPDAFLAVGHRHTYRLDTSGSVLGWIAGPLLNIERWYPTAITLSDGNLFVAGHEAQPSPTCPAPTPLRPIRSARPTSTRCEKLSMCRDQSCRRWSTTNSR